MLAIRMQRTGRKGHAMFRVVVQDSRRTPTSGKLVAQLGSYDPHAKIVLLNKEKAAFYLEHGAQPSNRVARLFSSEGLTLPKWFAEPAAKTRTVRTADKRRSTRPPEPVAEQVAEPAIETLSEPEAAAVATDLSDESAETETAPRPVIDEPAVEAPEPKAEIETEAAQPAGVEPEPATDDSEE